jgi:predicted nucleic acid-binding protein
MYEVSKCAPQEALRDLDRAYKNFFEGRTAKLLEEKKSKVKNALKLAFDVVGIGDEVIERYLELYDYVKIKGRSMNDLDLIIASTALAKEITLLTKDRDFEPILERLDVKFI